MREKITYVEEEGKIGMTAKEIHFIRNKLQILCQLTPYLVEQPVDEWDIDLIKEQAQRNMKAIDDFEEILVLTEET